MTEPSPGKKSVHGSDRGSAWRDSTSVEGRCAMSAHRAAIYCRVSTDLQLSGTSLTSQRDQCVDFTARSGWTVVAEFIEQGVSGAVADRPALGELLALCD